MPEYLAPGVLVEEVSFRKLDSLLSWRLEIAGHCFYLNDFVQHDNGRGTHAVHVVTTFHQTESTSINSCP